MSAVASNPGPDVAVADPGADPPRDSRLAGTAVLVVDDEEIMRDVLESLLVSEGCRVQLAADGVAGIEAARDGRFDAVLLDVMMPGVNGMDVLKTLRQRDPNLPVIMVTAYGTTQTVRDAMKGGAFDFIEKPFTNEDVVQVVLNAVEHHRQVTGGDDASRPAIDANATRFGKLLGTGDRMRGVFELVARAAPSRATILVTGESGTGKELVAQAVHEHSPRSDRPFVTVNSGSLPPDLLESNLFGHVKGAFTGAVAPKKGLFELADRGSIFFDEIGAVPLETQAKLLRVIQEREFMRLGGIDTVRVDVRIIAATNQDLWAMVAAGQFREDLYYRLHVITVDLPPLRERRGDIPLLVQHFLERFGEENDKGELELTPEALDLLVQYHWPGNVRELENVIERAVVLATSSVIDADLVPDTVRMPYSRGRPEFDIPPEGVPFREVIDDMEARLIVRALELAGGVQKKAAELLHMKPTTLNEMIKRHGIPAGRTRSGGNAGSGSPTAPGSAPPAPRSAAPSTPTTSGLGRLVDVRPGRSGTG
ncbi:MAG: sigma-54-dependent Fis family transcriptional regulator [Acidobacteria bacterium]|nr:sigma-54-dependent Fis family transcriptional regulator [Acidobacteriota bacterium]MYD70282.1 sigma-54-dependent Fis family transcriptional regulator [Acidobacteriota bacterium]MYJ04700.1 sigma-54-dependent Fis family transcriptional regulator [Acidobacteriota bacterium]